MLFFQQLFVWKIKINGKQTIFVNSSNFNITAMEKSQKKKVLSNVVQNNMNVYAFINRN